MYSRRVATSLWNSLVSYLAGRLLLTSQSGAAARQRLLIIGGGVLWALLAWFTHPYTPGAEPGRSLVDYPFRALFAADVFRHVLIAALAFWLAFRVAAVYLDDIFELRDVRIAERYIRQAVFASRYDTIEIRNGEIAQRHKLSPIVQIGGPGKVRVYLENAALFERIDGAPRVIPPTVLARGDEAAAEAPARRPRRWRRGFLEGFRLPLEDEPRFPVDTVRALEGFERLRAVIDLRDQVVEMNVYGRTRDGIRIRAENVRFIFSVYRGKQEATLTRPYPFSEEAILALVYDRPTTNWTAAMESQIRREIVEFIAKHSLGEFLAAINQPELEQQVVENARLQREADRRAGLDLPLEVATPNPPPFTSRLDLSNLFYDLEEFTAKARKRGVELRWIGIGTWSTPDEIIPERHQSAWRITRENLARGSDEALETLYEESRLGELLMLLYSVPLEAFRSFDPQDEDRKQENLIQVVHGYRGKLRAALDLYERDGKSDTPGARRLRAVLDHLAHVVYRWIGDGEPGS